MRIPEQSQVPQKSPDNRDAVLVTDESSFHRYCAQWSQLRAVGLDTEFMRTDTFFAKIGLLQVATESEIVLVDPLAISDWEPFRELLQASDCTVVIHSGSEDLNLLLTHCDARPVKLFDTQLAAAFLGLGFSNSYQSLCEKILGVHLEKGETRSDWLRRPLSSNQLHYAADDVRYLLALMATLEQGLRDQDKLDWFHAETRQQLQKARQVEDKQSWLGQFAGISNAWRLKERGRAFLQTLAYWREEEARRRNRPRNWVAKDNDLYTIANEMARRSQFDVESVQSLRLEDRKLAGRYGKTFVDLLQSAELVPGFEDQLNPPLQPDLRKTLKSLQRAVEAEAERIGIEPELLGRRKQLLRLLHGWLRHHRLDWEGGNSDWRRPLLEPQFRDVLASVVSG